MDRTLPRILLGLLATLALSVGLAACGESAAAERCVPGATPATADTPAGVIFQAEFTCRGLANYDALVNPERIALVDDPTGIKRKVARFRVRDDDIGPTPNPRAQIESPPVLQEGRDYWFGHSTYFPTTFPKTLPRGGWIAFGGFYGPPSIGSGPVGLGVEGEANQLRWQRNETYDYDLAWRTPLVRRQWYDFVWHVKLSGDERVGFVEMWMNTGDGWERQRLRGRKRLYMQTLDASNGEGPNDHRLSLYRKRGMFPVLTVFHAAHRIGTSFGAVAPRTYD